MEQSQLNERQKVKIRKPKRYKVIMHNDDFTTMDFVVMVLEVVFNKRSGEAQQLMMQIHHTNQAIVGIYSYDIAMSKSIKAMDMARAEGFPLRVTVEEE